MMGLCKDVILELKLGCFVCTFESLELLGVIIKMDFSGWINQPYDLLILDGCNGLIVLISA